MSIADKLTQVAENTHKVYEAGFEAGQQAEYDRFWDGWQQNGKRTVYDYAFAGNGWTLEMFKPKYDIKVSQARYMFAKFPLAVDLPVLLDELGVEIDFTECSALAYLFQESKLTRVGAIGSTGTSWMGCFGSCYNLKTIDRMIVKSSQTYSSTFQNCTALENLTIEGVIGKAVDVSACPLTHDSLMSIINALEAKTSGTFTVTLGSSNLAKLTDAEKAIATEKGWTIG